MKKTYTLFVLLSIAVQAIMAQQLSINDQYLINRYALSPTYSGEMGTELFIGYRNERINFPGATLINYISMDAPLNNNMALGGSILYDQTDVFKHVFASLSYTYRVKITDDQGLSFGLWGGIYENTFDFSNKNLESIINDPIVANKMGQRGTSINSGAGLLYNYKAFRFGFDVPHLIESGLNYKTTSDQTSPYRLRRSYQAHASYPFKIKKDWVVEPMAIGRYTLNSPINWEGAAMVKYKDTYWLTANLRSSMDVGIGAGGKINDMIVFQYVYEFSNKNLGVYNSGTHEIGIGYYFGRKVKKFVPTGYENDLVKQIDSLQKYTQKLQKDIEALQENSDAKYKDQVANLENEIANMKASMEDLLKEMTEMRENADFVEGDSNEISENYTGDKTYYVVLDSYKKIDRAARGSDLWKSKGYDAKVIYKKESGWYHVYGFSFNDMNQALLKMKQLRDKGLSKVWVLIYK